MSDTPRTNDSTPPLVVEIGPNTTVAVAVLATLLLGGGLAFWAQKIAQAFR